MIKSEEIAEKARKSIGKFCISECKAYCCRKGYLRLNSDEARLAAGGREEELEIKGVLKKIDDFSYSLYIGDKEVGCPSLKDYKCTIHDNPNRPRACREFPMFIEGKSIRLSKRCFAVKRGMLYPYVRMLISLGFKIHENEEYDDFDFESFEKGLNINKMEA